jgi:hypothetical protein
MFNKRQSLREKRAGRATPDRPASDSNISYAVHSELPAAQKTSTNPEYPEMPGDVPDWIRRRSEASRRPPRSMQILTHQEEHWPMASAHEQNEHLYELDSQPSLASGANGNIVPRTMPADGWRGEHAEPGVVQGVIDEDLARAIELSEREAFGPLRRTSTGGFDVDQIAEALNRSLHNM